MAKGRLLLVAAILAAFTVGSVSVASAGPIAPIKGPGPVMLIKKPHRKLHRRRRRHHRHHKKTAVSNTVFHNVKI